jgi:hypothetical protein
VSNILRFRKPPHVELSGGIVTGGNDPAQIGQTRYFVEYHDEEGGVLGVWDGASYEGGVAALTAWRQNGVRAIDLLGEALS